MQKQCSKITADFAKDCGLEPGDDILSVHIPAAAKLDRDSQKAAYERAKQFFDKYYPQLKPKAICCFSWLLDPKLKECLRENSNILTFQGEYNTFPVNSDGKEVFTFVFTEPFNTYADLPENTSLQRNIKKLYLNGGCIRAYGGIYKES